MLKVPIILPKGIKNKNEIRKIRIAPEFKGINTVL